MDTEAQYRADLQAFLTQRVIPQVAQWEREQTFPRAIICELGQQGFFRACLHATDLKQPLQMRMFRILIEELAKTYCFGLTLTISMHVGVFLPLIIRLAQPQLRATVIEQALDGDILGTIAITEDVAAGSDFMGMASTVHYEDDTLVLHGQKHYITNAAVADYVVTFARWRTGRHFANFSAILVPTAHADVHCVPIPMAIMKTAVISHIDFKQVRLPAHYMLGRKEFGMRYFLQHITTEHVSGGIWAAAVAEQCLVQAQRNAFQRHIGTETLWEKSSVRHRIAQAVTQITMLRTLVNHVIEKTVEQGTIDTLDSAVLKAAVAPMMETVIGTCLQLQGAHGLEAESPLLRLLNEFRVFGIAGGSTETALDIIAEQWAQHAMQLSMSQTDMQVAS